MITTSTTLHVHHVAMRHGVHHDDGQQRMFLQLVNAITEDLARDRKERTESVGYLFNEYCTYIYICIYITIYNKMLTTVETSI